MAKKRVIQIPHPSSYIREELDAREWTRDDLAREMGGDDIALNRLCVDMYFAVGPTHPGLRIGDECAAQYARAFGVSAQLFLNLERRWLEYMHEASMPEAASK